MGLVCDLADSELEQLLYPPPPSAGTPLPEPNSVTVDLELRRERHPRAAPSGVPGTAPRGLPSLLLLPPHYETWKKTQRPDKGLRQVHQGGR